MAWFWNREIEDTTLLSLIVGVLMLITIGAIAAANKYDSDQHSWCVGERLVLSGDTVEILKWNTSEPRGYVLSNGLVVDEMVVEHAKIVNEK